MTDDSVKELANIAAINQLIKIEKSIQSMNELLLCVTVQLIELNKVTKILNYISGGANLDDKAIMEELKHLRKYVEAHSETIQEIVRFKLPAPKL
jgi:hypothetical protein